MARAVAFGPTVRTVEVVLVTLAKVVVDVPTWSTSTCPVSPLGMLEFHATMPVGHDRLKLGFKPPVIGTTSVAGSAAPA